MCQESSEGQQTFERVLIQLPRNLVSTEALLKACYWFSRDFVCEVEESGDANIVSLTPRAGVRISAAELHDRFISEAQDFALRERIEVSTGGVRDLLLAKAFSEAGVLEDEPEGVFGDLVEESKPDGLFKILATK